MSEFKDALDVVNKYRSTGDVFVLENHVHFHAKLPTICRALLIAHRLMMEPSENMIIEAISEYVGDIDAELTWKAMRDEMLKEIENV